MTARVLWYWNRLRCMTPAEVMHRAREAAKLQWRARFGAAAGKAPAADLLATGRPWFAGDVKDLESLRRAADEIAQGRLEVLGLGSVQLGLQPQWLRCPRTGTLAPLEFGPGMALGNTALVGDIKHLWEPSRHNALVVLAQAWAATGEVAYLDALGRWLGSWIEQNPHPLGPHWASSLECGIRLINWAMVWHLVGAATPGSLFEGRHPGLTARWRESVYWHLRFVRGHLSAHSSANNHLIGELAGLYVGLATWPCWRAMDGWRADTRKRLLDEALKQNAPDGVNREQASSYQQFVLEFLLIAGQCAKAQGEDFSSPYDERLHAMCRFLAALVDAGGHLPQIGDADDGLACGVLGDAKDNALSLLATGAVLYDEPMFARAAGQLDAKTLWLLGAERCRRFEPLRRRDEVLALPQLFREGGYAVLGTRAGREDEVRIVFDVGPLGYLGIAAHGHADALSLQLSVGGQPVLVDPGTYRELQTQGVGMAVHAGARCLSFSDQSGMQQCSGRLDRYAGDAGLAHQRSVRFEPATGTLEVLDEVEGHDQHDLALHWHLAAGVRAEPVLGGVRLLTESCEVLLHLPEGCAVEVLRAGEGDPLGWVSTRYEKRLPSSVIRVSAPAARLPMRLLTRISVCSTAHPRPPVQGGSSLQAAGIILDRPQPAASTPIRNP